MYSHRGCCCEQQTLDVAEKEKREDNLFPINRNYTFILFKYLASLKLYLINKYFFNNSVKYTRLEHKQQKNDKHLGRTVTFSAHSQHPTDIVN